MNAQNTVLGILVPPLDLRVTMFAVELENNQSNMVEKQVQKSDATLHSNLDMKTHTASQWGSPRARPGRKIMGGRGAGGRGAGCGAGRGAG